MKNPIKNRYEFVVIFDVVNGNPNGDPDSGNAPRIDIETGKGIVTDVCLKRKIRNYVELKMQGKPHYNILIKMDEALNTKFARAYDECGLAKGKKEASRSNVEAAQKYICENFFDVRTFGAVMSTGDNPCGIVRGPVQLGFATSIDEVSIQENTITRQAVTKEEEFKKGNEMGRKHTIPYGLYRAEGYVSALLAQKVTGFNEDDLELLWEAIVNMFEHDRSAARGNMAVRKLIVFKHDSELGNAPAHKLFERVIITRKEGVAIPRSFADYNVIVDDKGLSGVTISNLV